MHIIAGWKHRQQRRLFSSVCKLLSMLTAKSFRLKFEIALKIARAVSTFLQRRPPFMLYVLPKQFSYNGAPVTCVVSSCCFVVVARSLLSMSLECALFCLCIHNRLFVGANILHDCTPFTALKLFIQRRATCTTNQFAPHCATIAQ